MKIKTAEATELQLDWLVAKCEGMYMHADGVRACNSDVESLAIPFTLWETSQVWVDDALQQVVVDPITVIRYGVATEDGATAPSITFVGSDGCRARGSVRNYYLTKAEAEKAAAFELNGYTTRYQPSTNWEQGGPIIEREGISTVFQGDAHDWVASLWSYPTSDWVLHTEGPTPLIAAMRCFVASKLGDEVDIPEELT